MLTHIGRSGAYDACKIDLQSIILGYDGKGQTYKARHSMLKLLSLIERFLKSIAKPK